MKKYAVEMKVIQDGKEVEMRHLPVEALTEEDAISFAIQRTSELYGVSPIRKTAKAVLLKEEGFVKYGS